MQFITVVQLHRDQGVSFHNQLLDMAEYIHLIMNDAYAMIYISRKFCENVGYLLDLYGCLP